MSEGLLLRMDAVRGLVPRATWVRSLVERELGTLSPGVEQASADFPGGDPVDAGAKAGSIPATSPSAPAEPVKYEPIPKIAPRRKW